MTASRGDVGRFMLAPPGLGRRRCYRGVARAPRATHDARRAVGNLPDGMRIAVLVKQIPEFEEMELGPDGRLLRAGLDLEMNAYCRRAVSQGVELAAAVGDGTVTVFTLGPPSADDVLREAIAWGLEAAVEIDGVLITDPAFAGSDTLATARALAAALEREGPFDLVLTGRNSIDADTGQVGPELAELLDLPFATGVRNLSMKGRTLHLRCEHDDGWVQLTVEHPVVVSCAERLIDPCKVPPDMRQRVPPERIRVLDASDLGAGPWGQAGSPTTVGEVRIHRVERARHRCHGTPAEQVAEAVAMLVERGALEDPDDDAIAIERVPSSTSDGPTLGVVLEPGRAHLARELLGAAAVLAADLAGAVTAVTRRCPARRGPRILGRRRRAGRGRRSRRRGRRKHRGRVGGGRRRHDRARARHGVGS